MTTTDEIHDLAQQLRVDSIRATSAAESGHPTSSMSAADLMAVLIGKYLRFDFDQPEHPNGDHFIFSKGHASPLLYAMFKAMGAASDEDILSLRKFGSKFEGHPVPNMSGVDVATGSLGQGLPIGVGIAIAGKYLHKLPYRTWVLLGDSEMAEGSVWEALDKAAYYKLGNLVGIIDVNRLGQRGATDLGWNTAAYAERARSFGWDAIEIDGHDLEEIDEAFAQAMEAREKPLMIVAKTVKGKGVSFLEDVEDMHGKPVPADKTEEAIKELGGATNIVMKPQQPEDKQPAKIETKGNVELPTFEVGDKAATRKVFGAALAALGARPDVVALDAEVSNSTYSKEFKDEYPDRFFEMFIAEQQLVSATVGMDVMGYTAFASTFAAFFTRAYDFIRMAAVSKASIRLVGSHAGVSIGEDGPSQMALEDLAMMRAVFGSTVLYPCDGNQTAKLMQAMADQKGVSYMRTTRESTPVIYGPDEEFPIGGSKVVRQSDDDQVTLVGAGVTLHEAMKAADTLAEEGINARVIDVYSVKPIDGNTLREAAEQTNGLIVVEDHWPEGGIGDAVLDACSSVPVQIVKLAVRSMPGSGQPEEMRDAMGIDAAHIAEAARKVATASHEPVA